MGKVWMKWFWVACFALVLAGCAGTDQLSKSGQASVEDQGISSTKAGAKGTGAEAHGVGEGSGFQGDELNNPKSPLHDRIIYFAFDSSEIAPKYQSLIEAHAAYLAKHPNTMVTLNGYTDERGSPEYNLALGERRAMAVRRQLVLLGASAGQIKVVSYGETHPAALGHNEAAWAKNRRVVIVY